MLGAAIKKVRIFD